MVTMKDVRRAIDPDEPDYAKAAKLGPGALPHLAQLSKSEDVMTASKAVSLTGLIGGPAALPILEEAAEADPPEIRVVTAVAAGRIGSDGEEVLLRLLKDGDTGVRKYAVRAVPDTAAPGLRGVLEEMRESDSDVGVRRAVDEALGHRKDARR